MVTMLKDELKEMPEGVEKEKAAIEKWREKREELDLLEEAKSKLEEKEKEWEEEVDRLRNEVGLGSGSEAVIEQAKGITEIQGSLRASERLIEKKKEDLIEIDELI